MKLLSTEEAAIKLGISRNRVLVLIAENRLPAQKVVRDYVIQESDLKLVAVRKPGRPRKAEKK
jgi:excisionase family DNA binding protein